MNTDQFTELDLRRFVGVLRARALLISTLVVVSFVGVFAFTSMRPDLYRAFADVRVTDSSATAALGQGSTYEGANYPTLRGLMGRLAASTMKQRTG